MVLETDDCLLSIRSLREDSLWDMDMHFLLGAWARKCRQGTCSAMVSLLRNDGPPSAKASIPLFQGCVTHRLDDWTHLYLE